MKILTYTDVHYCPFSSLIRGRGKTYTDRIENCIKSVNWAEELATKYKCDAVVCGGDFFDTAGLGSEEITSINDIKFNTDIPHYMIVGNHEMGSHDLSYSTAHIFDCLGFNVIDKPTALHMDAESGNDIFFLPYVLESDRRPLVDYLNECNVSNPVIFSHNDLKNVDLGHGILSSAGFDIGEVEANCAIFVNGHLHNGSKISDKVINLGNLTGNSFGEDGFTYKHNVMILDTVTLEYELIENPYAFKFYKLDFTKKSDVKYIDKISSQVGSNAVLSVSCKEKDLAYLKSKFDPNYVSDECPKNSNVLYCRTQVVRDKVKADEADIVKEKVNTVDHIDRFKTHIMTTVGTDSIVLEELSEITG